MRPTRPKPMTPMPTRSLAPTTRFQEEAPRAAAAVPALIKVRRVSSFCGFGVDARVGGFISRRGWQRRGAEARGAMAWLFRVHAERVNDWNEFSIPSARGCFPLAAMRPLCPCRITGPSPILLRDGGATDFDFEQTGRGVGTDVAAVALFRIHRPGGGQGAAPQEPMPPPAHPRGRLACAC